MDAPIKRTASATAATHPLRQRWQALDSRERRGVLLAASVVVLAALWWLAIAPVLHTWRSAPADHQRLDAQLAQMQKLQTEARQLQSATTLTTAQARQQLESSLTQQLGNSAKMNVLGERVTVTLSNAPAAAVQTWLSQVRANAHAIPQELRITRSASTDGKPAASAPTWTGSIVLNLPAQ